MQTPGLTTTGIWTHLTYLLFRRVLLTYRSTIWWFIGYCKLYGKKTYETSARVERVIWRSKIDTFSSIKPWHFVGVHERNVHPNFVLSDDVILCCLTLEEAVFVQLPSSVKNFTGDRCPFLWIALFENAVRTITMPIDSLIRLAETEPSVSTFKMKSLLLSNAGRCGSTLLAKLIQVNCDRVLVLSEPDPLQSLQEYTKRFKGKYGKEEFLRIMRAAMLLSFKPVHGIDGIVIKIRMTTMRVMKYVYRAAPEIKHLYLQRKDRLKTVQSWERAFSLALEARIFGMIGRLGLINWYVKHFYNGSRGPMNVLRAAMKHLHWTMFETMMVLWADNADGYEYCKRHCHIPTMYYEDMTANPLEALRYTLRLLDIPENGTSGKSSTNGILGLDDDSQRGTPLAMKAIDRRQATTWTPQLKERVNAFLVELHITPFD